MKIRILVDIGAGGRIAKKGQVYEVERIIRRNPDWTRFIVTEGRLVIDLENNEFEIIDEEV